MKIGIFNNPLISFPLIILCGLFISYRSINFSNDDLISEKNILKSNPHLIDRYKRNSYFEFTTIDNKVFNVDFKSLKKLKDDPALFNNFKNLKRGDTIFVKYLNLSKNRKNVQTPYYRIAHLEFKNKIIINQDDVKTSDKKGYFILISMISLILFYGLYLEFKTFQISKSSN